MEYLPFVTNAEITVIGSNNGLWGSGEFSTDTAEGLVAKNSTAYPNLPLPIKARNAIYAINGRGSLPVFQPTCASHGLDAATSSNYQPCDEAACGDGAGKQARLHLSL